jgi:16S rRNA pseudouridine516 synthase
MRLDKLIAAGAGLSRSAAREIIRQGRVSMNGELTRAVDAPADESSALTLDGKPLAAMTQRHIMLYKPIGVLTAARDHHQRTVMDLLPEQLRRLKCMPVGRLDKDTEGLLLFTTEGELAHRLLSPKRGIEKVYSARVTGKLSEEDQAAFETGVALSDFTARPAKLDILRMDEQFSEAEVTLHEGKHRQVRRMFGALGHEVTALKRLRFGPLCLDERLKPGGYRDLTEGELASLRGAAGFD